MMGKRIIIIMYMVLTVFVGCNSSSSKVEDENKSFVGEQTIVDHNKNKDNLRSPQNEQDNNEKLWNYMPERL